MRRRSTSWKRMRFIGGGCTGRKDKEEDKRLKEEDVCGGEKRGGSRDTYIERRGY